MKTLFLRIGLLLTLFFGAILLRAEDMGAVKARIAERLSTLDNLRKQGVIGENNRGFTEVLKTPGAATEVSTSENRDREFVYAELAKKTGSDAGQVGRARARQIVSNSRAGLWLQRDSGEWYQK